MKERIGKLASQTHKDRVHEFNSKLEALSEHHDIPKVGPGSRLKSKTIVDHVTFRSDLANTRRALCSIARCICFLSIFSTASKNSCVTTFPYAKTYNANVLLEVYSSMAKSNSPVNLNLSACLQRIRPTRKPGPSPQRYAISSSQVSHKLSVPRTSNLRQLHPV